MVIVYGAGGFVGTYLTDALIAAGYEVAASDINEISEAHYRDRGIPYYRVDISNPTDFDILPTKDVKAVVHLACVQPANVSEKHYLAQDFIRVNVIGTLNILDFCRSRGVKKIIYTASHRNTQGLWPEKAGNPIRESDGRSIKFSGEYAMFSISESAATDCVRHYTEAFGLKGITLRLPPVYGYGPHFEGFRNGKPIKTGFQIFIENAQRGEPLVIWGDAAVGRDIAYVKDVVAALLLAIEKPEVTGIYNISSGRQLSLKEQAEAIVKVFSPFERRSEIQYRPDKPNGQEPYVYDISKARTVLGWEPKFSFEAMLEDYKQEEASGRFSFLLEKRRALMKSAASA